MYKSDIQSKNEPKVQMMSKKNPPKVSEPTAVKRKKPNPSTAEIFAEIEQLQKLAIKEQRTFSWLLTSIFIGLTMLSVGVAGANLIMIPGGIILALFGLLNLGKQRRIIRELQNKLSNFLNTKETATP